MQGVVCLEYVAQRMLISLSNQNKKREKTCFHLSDLLTPRHLKDRPSESWAYYWAITHYCIIKRNLYNTVYYLLAHIGTYIPSFLLKMEKSTYLTSESYWVSHFLKNVLNLF